MNEARETVNTNNTISIFPRPDDEQEQPQQSSKLPKPPWVKLFELVIYAVAGLIGFKIFLEYLK